MPVWAWKNQPSVLVLAAISTMVAMLPVGVGELAEGVDFFVDPGQNVAFPAARFAVAGEAVVVCQGLPSVCHGMAASLPTFSRATSPARFFSAANGSYFGAFGVGAGLEHVGDELRRCGNSEPPLSGRRLGGDHVFRRALDDDAAALIAGFGAEVDDPVGRLDHVEIVLDDDDRVAQIDQAIEHVEQLADVVEVQAGGRLVEDVDGLAGVGPGQLGGQLDALGLAAGQRRRRLGRARGNRGRRRPAFAGLGGSSGCCRTARGPR